MEIAFFWLAVVGTILLARGFRVINQYERAVVLTLGKFSGVRNPGLTWILPIFQRILRADLRLTTIDIPKQEVITKDNVPAYINGVVYFMVEKPENAILSVQNYVYAISQYAQAALRDVIGGIELDTLLSERTKIADEIEKMVEKETEGWGVRIHSIKIQDIELPADMKRLMAKQAEAERERRSVIIRAEGELTASENMKKAAQNLTSIPGGMSLRALTTIETTEKGTIFAIPIEIMEGFARLAKKAGE
ncbi:slipin family protein [Candidatus Uhrbacteria bacterium]|nr:slipin family protein [Candidatus Uhrbacteria bacterium]